MIQFTEYYRKVGDTVYCFLCPVGHSPQSDPPAPGWMVTPLTKLPFYITNPK